MKNKDELSASKKQIVIAESDNDSIHSPSTSQSIQLKFKRSVTSHKTCVICRKAYNFNCIPSLSVTHVSIPVH